MALARHVATASLALTLLGTTSASADLTKDQCVDANTQSQELRRTGKFAEARQKLRACAAATCPAIVQSDCTTRLDELEKAQPTIVFAAKDASGADVTAVVVTVDGKPLIDKLDGTAVQVDPGRHVFAFTAAGKPPISRTLLITEGEKGRREVVDLGGGTGTTGAGQGATTPVAPQTRETIAGGDTGGGGLGTQKILALVAGGIGVVGVGVGSAFGLIAMSKKNDAQSVCPNVCATQDGATKWSDAATAGNVSTVGFIVGGVGLAGAAVLWLTAPSHGGSAVQVGIGPGAITLKGTL